MDMKTPSHPLLSNRRAAVLVLAAILSAFPLVPKLPFGHADPQKPHSFSLQPGDHICIIGNALAERMQHDGWLETYLHARFPKHDLTIRNLGFSGDEVAGFTDQPNSNHSLRDRKSVV